MELYSIRELPLIYIKKKKKKKKTTFGPQSRVVKFIKYFRQIWQVRNLKRGKCLCLIVTVIMSTNGSSLGWLDLLDSRPPSSSSEKTAQQTQQQLMPKFSEKIALPMLDELSESLPDKLNVRDTYIIYSVGNSTLFMSSLDPLCATDHQMELLDRHLVDVKIANPVGPLWPNPGVLTVDMRTKYDCDLPGTSSAVKSANGIVNSSRRRYRSKTKCIKLTGKKRSK